MCVMLDVLAALSPVQCAAYRPEPAKVERERTKGRDWRRRDMAAAVALGHNQYTCHIGHR